MATSEPSQDAAVLERLARLEDLDEIRQLSLEYGVHMDAKDWKPFSEVFTEDGELVAAIGVVSGRHAIEALFDTTLREVPQSFHVFGEPEIDVDGDRATARSRWAYVWTGPDGWPQILQYGHYEDALVRTDGRWLFERREVTRDIGHAPYKR
jgi:uncharacterized protein (TIGR02246 family)